MQDQAEKILKSELLIIPDNKPAPPFSALVDESNPKLCQIEDDEGISQMEKKEGQDDEEQCKEEEEPVILSKKQSASTTPNIEPLSLINKASQRAVSVPSINTNPWSSSQALDDKESLFNKLSPKPAVIHQKEVEPKVDENEETISAKSPSGSSMNLSIKSDKSKSQQLASKIKKMIGGGSRERVENNDSQSSLSDSITSGKYDRRSSKSAASLRKEPEEASEPKSPSHSILKMKSGTSKHNSISPLSSKGSLARNSEQGDKISSAKSPFRSSMSLKSLKGSLMKSSLSLKSKESLENLEMSQTSLNMLGLPEEEEGKAFEVKDILPVSPTSTENKMENTEDEDLEPVVLMKAGNTRSCESIQQHSLKEVSSPTVTVSVANLLDFLLYFILFSLFIRMLYQLRAK